MQFARGGYMIYIKRENFPFPENAHQYKWYLFNIHRYRIHQTQQIIKMLCIIFVLRCCFNLIIETSAINIQFVGKRQRTPKKFWTETTTYSLIIYKQTTLIIILKSTCWNLKLYKYILSLCWFIKINVLREKTDIMEARKN